VLLKPLYAFAFVMQVLTTSFDQTVRIHGLKSGRTLKEFRGHGAYVNAACYTADGARVVSGAADGEVKVYDDILHTMIVLLYYCGDTKQ
jgi:WD40 repeat protein